MAPRRRAATGRLALIWVLVAIAAVSAQARAGGSRFGVHTGEETYDSWNRHSVYVPMKDGTRIAVDYYLPTAHGAEAAGKLPVVLHYTRYGRAVEDDKGS